MRRHGDTCALCEELILERREMVAPAAYPWLLADVEGVAHRACANAEMESVAQASADTHRNYWDGIAEGLEHE